MSKKKEQGLVWKLKPGQELELKKDGVPTGVIIVNLEKKNIKVAIKKKEDKEE